MQLFPGRLSYLLVLVLALIDFVWIAVSDITFSSQQLFIPFFTVSILAIAILLVKNTNNNSQSEHNALQKIAYLAQGMIFLQISWIAVRLFNHLSMTLAFPYVDATLSKWDSLIGLDWETYFNFINGNELIKLAMSYSYTSLTTLSFLGFFILVIQGDLKRVRFFLETFLFTAVICTTIGMFFPARAAVAMHYGDATTLANLTTLPGVYHIESLERLRSGVSFPLDLNNLPGLVTFPSFHTAAGIILIVSFWRTSLFPIILSYSAIMIASTPVLGGHYFVDLIGGATIAVLVAYVFASLPFYKGMFAQVGITVGQPEATRSPLQESI